MPVGHLDDFVQELKRVGEAAFRKRHLAPVLIVTGRATRGKRAGTEEVTRAISTLWTMDATRGSCTSPPQKSTPRATPS